MVGGSDGWAGMTEGREWWMLWLRKRRHSSDAVALRQACHSRESGNLEPFAMGRLALEGWPWIPGPRLGSGSWNDVGAVDSRFHGNDRWAGVAVGGNDRWGAMRKGRPFLRGAPPWSLGFLGVVFAGFSFCGPSGMLHRPPVWPLCPVSGLRWPVRHRRSYP